MAQGALIPEESPEVLAERRHARAQRQAAADATCEPRVVTAQRDQVELRPMNLDSVIGVGHRARAVWALVEQCDLRRFYEGIKARGSTAGRSSTDPKVLLALWIYATMDGVARARELDRLCHAHDAYRWIRGGVPVNHHTLSDFRSSRGKALNDLVTQVIGVMAYQGLVSLKRVAQDGTRVRASAGKGSFRRRRSLDECMEAARAHVAAVKAQAARSGETLTQRQQAARAHAARERLERVEKAIEALEHVQADREATKKGANDPTTPPRGSTTDPEARMMRMGDGGFRPAYNVQCATDTTSGVVVGVAVSQNRTDFDEGPPMMRQIFERTEAQPEELLVDSGFTSKDAVEKLSEAGVTVYGALPVRKGQPDPYAERAGDSTAMSDLRARMRSEAGQAIYRERAPTAELVNADMKTWRTLDRFWVRGQRKVLCVVLLNVLAHNFLRWIALSSSAT
jgi:transposase